ncbi:MAG: signal recognition particle protein [Deltaproteobacteria bacterium]|nr:signal recognition particle protein [Deltaproteobacteria bacterium]
MFDALHDKLNNAFKKILGRGVVGERDLEETLKAVRLALLEADVNFKVAKEFCARISEKALGAEVQKSLTPDQQIIKLVHQQLIEVMGGQAAELNLKVAPPCVIMLAGLQGCGKTTTAAKLARLLKQQFKRTPLLVPADIYRPAAIDQLKKLGKQLEISVYDTDPTLSPVETAKSAVSYANNHGFDCVILDTAGRLQIDDGMMQELVNIQASVQPHEILLVADAMTGQQAVNIAQGFSAVLRIDGLILTKLDGDARGGAALSMRAVTGKPIKMVGVGEKLDALEVFHPERMASRILGMGDVLGLIEKATQAVSLEESLELQKKIKKDQLTLEDFLGQLRMVKRMGNLGSLMSMIPGLGKMVKKLNEEDAEREMRRVEAIILSMTPAERRNHTILNGSRRRRIAKGSGVSIEAINSLIKQFVETRKIMGKLSKMGMGGLMEGLMGGRGLGRGALR